MADPVETGISNRPVGDNSDWLAMHSEAVLEPELPICDPHHHLWDFEAHRYLLPELLEDLTSGHDVRSSVFETDPMFLADQPSWLALKFLPFQPIPTAGTSPRCRY